MVQINQKPRDQNKACKEVSMKDLKTMKKELRELDNAIKRLQTAE